MFKPLDEVRLINVIAELLGATEKEGQNARAGSAAQSFLSTLPPELLDEEVFRQLSLLKVAQQNKDMAAVRDQAHQLRSVLYGMVDTDDIVVAVRQLEQACGRNDVAAVAETFVRLEEKLNQCMGG